MSADSIANRSLAKRNLLDFARLVYPRFDDPPHLRLIAGLLEEMERGDLRRLMLNVSVRHGKSVLASQLFPAWFLGRHPDLQIVLASHSEELAVRNSRVAKHFLEDDRWPFDVELSSDSSAAGRWNTKQGGGCYATSVGGAITGRGSDVLVIDDALHDGLSAAERKSAFEWYSEVAFPRLEPGGSLIQIGARFAEDDLCGRILESEDGPNWKVVRLPALAEENDPLGRQPGEALWPARMDVPEIEMRRIAMGTRAFEAQFQQRPSPAAGALIQRAWFDPSKRYSSIPTTETVSVAGYYGGHQDTVTRPPWLASCAFFDTAATAKTTSDWSAVCVGTIDRNRNMYIRHVERRRVEFNDLIKFVQEIYRDHTPGIVAIEKSLHGLPVLQELKRATGIPVIGVRPEGDKVSRTQAILGWLEAGKVRLPLGAAWVEDALDEWCQFPNGRHDDRVDALVGCMNHLLAAVESAAYVSRTRRQTRDFMAR